MTSIDCFTGPTHTSDECAARCLHCGSTAIRDEVEYIHCLDCNARENDIGLFPHLDAYDSFVDFFAPAYATAEDETRLELPRKPHTAQQQHRRRVTEWVA